ncbi:hypothetical protein A0H81_11473 [Grifola frondosa]|uniref:Uncharacterized protein n=1 Tax=Grifola frondosa TaxID=5627 RepID=A0A1C7LVE0_GRIFR|nr:hypothetical protein A0H81_11473 [Grifola frondosa]
MSSLSSVVSNLVRASMGTSLSSTITDEDLDRHVAELILKEAKQKAERYGKEGMRAYLPQIADSNAPKTNKRFLSSIIRSTDDHNKTILRAQALAAQEVRILREEQERRERKARAEEATEAERMRPRGETGREWRGAVKEIALMLIEGRAAREGPKSERDDTATDLARAIGAVDERKTPVQGDRGALNVVIVLSRRLKTGGGTGETNDGVGRWTKMIGRIDIGARGEDTAKTAPIHADTSLAPLLWTDTLGRVHALKIASGP